MAGGRRSYGTGSLHEHRGAWYGKWWIGNRQVKRKIGAKRKPGSREGLTRRQAEARLRRLIEEVQLAPPDERVTLADAGERYIDHLGLIGRKDSTIQDYRIILHRYLVPAFGQRALDQIAAYEVAGLMHVKLRQGFADSTINHQLNLLQGIFQYGMKWGWARTNPVASVERPRRPDVDPDIRYLTVEEMESLLRAVPGDELGAIDRVLYLTAAMTGARQGELCALRWQDVDWFAGVIRVRRSYSRGRWSTPKSRRSCRTVPLADRVGAELERLFRRSAFQADGDLVFCHPKTGHPYDASKLRRRFKAALRRAGVRDVRFHDLRHTFGTSMASAGAPLRAVQEWLGHRDYRATAIYADYAPDPSQGRTWAERAFRADADPDAGMESPTGNLASDEAGTNSGTNLRESGG
jgi:integrase